MKITQYGDSFTLNDVSRAQLTRIALAVGARPISWYVDETRDYVGINWSVTADYGNEYEEMLEALGIDVNTGPSEVADHRED